MYMGTGILAYMDTGGQKYWCTGVLAHKDNGAQGYWFTVQGY